MKFINENRDKLGENWSNLETMISQLADAIVYFKENSSLLYSNQFNRPLASIIKQHKLDWRRGVNYSSKLYIADTFLTLFDEKGWSSLEREVALEKLNNKFIRQLDLL